jgi:hypothetical protein
MNTSRLLGAVSACDPDVPTSGKPMTWLPILLEKD